MKKNPQLPICDVETTVKLVNSKWKVLIIRDLMTGSKRNSELKRSLSGISQKVLTMREWGEFYKTQVNI